MSAKEIEMKLPIGKSRKSLNDIIVPREYDPKISPFKIVLHRVNSDILKVELPSLPFSWDSPPFSRPSENPLSSVPENVSEVAYATSSAFSWAEKLSSWIYRASSNIEAIELIGLTREVCGIMVLVVLNIFSMVASSRRRGFSPFFFCRTCSGRLSFRC